VQRQQSILIQSGYTAKIFAHRKRDSTTDLPSNVTIPLEASTSDRFQTQAEDPSSAGSVAGSSSRKVLSEVTQENSQEFTSQINRLPPAPGRSLTADQGNSFGVSNQHPTGSIGRWLLLCFYHNEYVSRATHLPINENTSDIKLVRELRKEYIAAKGRFRFYLNPLRKVTDIKFVRVCTNFRLKQDI
jgi:hypothetical protein